ncbi:MAG: glycosyltransferase family 4 protein [Bacteroides sp.]|nr:glycosyltransferase family 4 protein [Bacteroides sp.]
MRILHVVNAVNEGGIRTLLLDMVEYQIKEGNEVAILCTLKDTRYYKATAEFEKTKVKIIRGDYNNPYNPMHIRIIRKYMKSFDVVHVHMFPNQLYAKIALNLLPRKLQPAIITTEHSTYNNRRKYPLLKLIDRWFYKSYDKIVGISQPTANNLTKWLNSPQISKNIVTINNGININKFKNARSNIDSIIPFFCKEDKYVVMVARLEQPKDPITLVRALKYCLDYVHVIFIGSGSLVSSIQDEVGRLGLNSRVHILGNREDVPQILKGCDIGVLSTQWEGFGLVAVEYMAAGLPVVVTDVEGVKEVVGDPDSLFPYQDEKRLGERIMKLLEDEKYREEKILHSLAQAAKYSVTEMNEHYLSVYNEVIKKQNNKYSI